MRIQPLDHKKIGWQDIYIMGYSDRVHVFYCDAGKDEKNILMLHTPVTAEKNC